MAVAPGALEGGASGEAEVLVGDVQLERVRRLLGLVLDLDGELLVELVHLVAPVTLTLLVLQLVRVVGGATDVGQLDVVLTDLRDKNANRQTSRKVLSGRRIRAKA